MLYKISIIYFLSINIAYTESIYIKVQNYNSDIKQEIIINNNQLKINNIRNNSIINNKNNLQIHSSHIKIEINNGTEVEINSIKEDNDNILDNMFKNDPFFNN